jgi:MFS family permease
MGSYLAVLRIRAARNLLLSTLPARVAYSMVGLSIFFHVQHSLHSITTAGFALGLNGLAGALTAGARGAVMDRFGQSWPLQVLVPAYSASLVGFSFVHERTSLLVVAMILGASAPPINLSARPLWKHAVPKKILRAAYAVDVTALNGSAIFGPVIATSVSLSIGADWSLRLCAFLLFSGGVALALQSISRRWQPETKPPGTVPLWKVPAIRLLMLEGAIIGFGWGSFDVAVPAATTLVHHQSLSGPIFAALSFGTVIGGLVGGMASRRISSLKGMLLSYTAWAISAIPLLFVKPSWLLIVIGLLIGVAGGPLQIFYWEVIEAVRPAGTAVSALAWIWAVEGTFASAGSALSGTMADRFGARWSLSVTPIAIFLGFCVVMVGRGQLAKANRRPSAASDESAMSVSEDPTN